MNGVNELAEVVLGRGIVDVKQVEMAGRHVNGAAHNGHRFFMQMVDGDHRSAIAGAVGKVLDHLVRGVFLGTLQEVGGGGGGEHPVFQNHISDLNGAQQRLVLQRHYGKLLSNCPGSCRSRTSAQLFYFTAQGAKCHLSARHLGGLWTKRTVFCTRAAKCFTGFIAKAKPRLSEKRSECRILDLWSDTVRIYGALFSDIRPDAVSAGKKRPGKPLACRGKTRLHFG